MFLLPRNIVSDMLAAQEVPAARVTWWSRGQYWLLAPAAVAVTFTTNNTISGTN